ncbi:MAG: helix-turn-helix transcriptional regulator [Pseudonocardia sp.]
MANRRVVAGYTQEGLAEALGVDRTTIGRWERGAQLPQPWQRPDLARLLGVTLERLDVLLRPQSAAHEVA